MTKVILSHLASELVKAYFKDHHFDIHLFKGLGTYDAVIDHPDMFMFYDKTLFLDKRLDLKGTPGESIGESYPDNIKYNVCKIGPYIFGKYAKTAQVILDHVDHNNYTFVDVKQGYAKCSTAVIDDRSIITSDKSIYQAALKHDIDVLLIRPGHILLPGLDYGFIGGACVRFENIVFFSGDITKHPDYEIVKSFIEQRDLKIDYVNEPLTDLGSFIIIESVA